jgi:uncharacterized protein YkwD
MPSHAPRRAAARWSVIVVAAFALTAVGLFAAPASTFAWSSNSFSSADESQLVALTNQARASAGLPALRVDSALVAIARWRSKDMSVRNYFSHDIPNPPGGNVFAEMDRRGYCYHVAGENIGWNNASDSTATSKIQALFMGSPGHRANILGKSWDHIGVGAYKDASGKHYWTVLFADTCGSTPKPTPKPTPRPAPRATPRPTARPTPRPTPKATEAPTGVSASASAELATPSPTDFLTEPPPVDTSPAAVTAGASPSPGDGSDQAAAQTFRVVDPPASPGLFETIVGGVAGFFLGG